MRTVVGFQLFDRADWRRKVRMPNRLRKAESEKQRFGSPEDRKASEKW
jgi:hypothetical protein